MKFLDLAFTTTRQKEEGSHMSTHLRALKTLPTGSELFIEFEHWDLSSFPPKW